jgi:hypothetical protein
MVLDLSTNKWTIIPNTFSGISELYSSVKANDAKTKSKEAHKGKKPSK